MRLYSHFAETAPMLTAQKRTGRSGTKGNTWSRSDASSSVAAARKLIQHGAELIQFRHTSRMQLN